MAKVKSKKLISILAVALLIIMSFGLVGCGESANALSLSGHEDISTTVGGDLAEMIAGVTITYTPQGGEKGALAEADEAVTATGLADMQSKGINVQWSGSAQAGKGEVSFAFKGYIVTCEYTITQN